MKLIISGVSGVFVWDFNLIKSKYFVTRVRQLNTLFVFISFFFFLFFLFE